MAADSGADNLLGEASLGRKIAFISIFVGVILASTKILIGWKSGSTSVLSDGFEASGDVLSSGIVYAGLWLASKPPDAEHPYGHGRYETLAGLAVGAILLLAGAGILWHSFSLQTTQHSIPLFALAPLLGSIVLKVALASWKFRTAKRITSSSLSADAWHDLSDLLSTSVALIAVLLVLYDPSRFAIADRVGGIFIGILIVVLSARVVRQTVDQLVDTMPEAGKLTEIRECALNVPGAMGIEKCLARRTGLKYHVDLHLEVDPDMTVRKSHEIATDVRFSIKRTLPWVADVLVHVEPSPAKRTSEEITSRVSMPHGK
jgi:cation diffusion facilitator family transporter